MQIKSVLIILGFSIFLLLIFFFFLSQHQIVLYILLPPPTPPILHIYLHTLKRALF
ncbi:hypothetical protein E1A91_D03G122200v1 [Gossypium mustelinum]|uniref:Uncharacterized protein n=1 Tax=Gossypium mustelinum TaxID=34275 RepID=A0A5D2VLR0_GOSMU|nr:hypothetical protein E1A91_D03G122200v1 [Gossypium mustelinum]